MAIVSNTSPLSYLILIGHVDILPRLYGTICIPNAVLAELRAPDSPEAIKTWASAPPSWLTVRDAATLISGLFLHSGESHAISLARELNADRLIIDDFAGRQAARSLGIPIVGTLGILDLAAERGLVDIPGVLPLLLATNFRIAQYLIDELLQRDAQRRKQNGR